MNFENAEIKSFIEALASNSPAPGGGSASALCGALSAALSSMVANLTVGKEKFAAQERQMQELISETKKFSEEFVKLMQEDIDAYSFYMCAVRMPKGDDLEKRARKAAMQDALKLSTQVPIKMLEAALQVLELAKIAALFGNPNAISDAGASAIFAQAAAKTASYNVYMNLPHIDDIEFSGSVQLKMKETLKKINAIASEIDALICKIFDATVNKA